MGKLDDTLTMHVDGFEDVIKKMQILSKIDRTEYNAFKKGIKNLLTLLFKMLGP